MPRCCVYSFSQQWSTSFWKLPQTHSKQMFVFLGNTPPCQILLGIQVSYKRSYVYIGSFQFGPQFSWENVGMNILLVWLISCPLLQTTQLALTQLFRQHHCSSVCKKNDRRVFNPLGCTSHDGNAPTCGVIHLLPKLFFNIQCKSRFKKRWWPAHNQILEWSHVLRNMLVSWPKCKGTVIHLIVFQFFSVPLCFTHFFGWKHPKDSTGPEICCLKPCTRTPSSPTRR